MPSTWLSSEVLSIENKLELSENACLIRIECTSRPNRDRKTVWILVGGLQARHISWSTNSCRPTWRMLCLSVRCKQHWAHMCGNQAYRSKTTWLCLSFGQKKWTVLNLRSVTTVLEENNLPSSTGPKQVFLSDKNTHWEHRRSERFPKDMLPSRCTRHPAMGSILTVQVLRSMENVIGLLK